MNKKGQLGIGLIIVVAIAIVIGLIMFQAIASNVDQGTRAASGVVTVNNYTFNPGAAGTVTILSGQELVGTPTVLNASLANGVVTATNYTVAECVRSTDNLKGICYTQKAGQWASQSTNISYTYYPDGYIDDAGARGLTGIIVLLTAIGIALIAYLGVRTKFD